MDFLTLEMMELTVSQAVLELGRVLELHPGARLRILLGSDEMVRHNLLRLLERKGRACQIGAAQHGWTLDVTATRVQAPPLASRLAQEPVRLLDQMVLAVAPLQQAPAPHSPPAVPLPPPLLLLRSGMDTEHPILGRRMLMGVLEHIPSGTPWVALAMEALNLLEDDAGRRGLESLQSRGIQVRISRESQMLLGCDSTGFEEMADVEWQRMLATGEARLLC